MAPNLFDLNPHYGLIQITGHDAFTFLQGLLSCDLDLLKTQDHCFGALCNIKGRVRALFRIFNSKEHYYLMTTKGLISPIIPILKKHGMFSKIKILDVSQEWSILGFIGNEQEYFSLPFQSLMTTLTINETRNRKFLIFPNKDAQDFLPKNSSFRNYAEWAYLNIQDQIPEVFIETSEQFLPHYLELPRLNAVSFSKGCYCGQEIIARMEYLGKIKYHLRSFQCQQHENSQNELIPGTELTNIGTVIYSTLVNDKIVALILSPFEASNITSS